MGNIKNRAKKNKRLSNNWRKLIQARKKKVPKTQKNEVLQPTTIGSAIGESTSEHENVKDYGSDGNSTTTRIASKLTLETDVHWETDLAVENQNERMNAIRHNQDDGSTMKSTQKIYVVQKCDPHQHTRIYRADFHQGDERFGNSSRDKQYAAISVVALSRLIRNNNPATWTTSNLNNILINGDGLYRASYNRMTTERSIQSTALVLEDILPYVRIGDSCYKVDMSEYREDVVLNRNNLVATLNRFLIEKNYQTGIFSCGIFSFAIIRNAGSFYMFNSRATDYDGGQQSSLKENSAACLMEMFTISCLADTLLMACDERSSLIQSKDTDLNDGTHSKSMFFITSISFVPQSIESKVLNRKRKHMSVESKRKSDRIEEMKRSRNDATQVEKDKNVANSLLAENVVSNENQENIEIENESRDNKAQLRNNQGESEENSEETDVPVPLSGRRIVDIAFLFEQMKYINKHSDSCTSEMIFRKETKLGFRSIFHFSCEECGVFHQVQSSTKNDDYMNVNLAATLGVTSIGSGFYHLEEMCAHWNVPCMSSGAFDDAQKKLQKNWSELSTHHTKQALLEEIRIARERGEVDSAGNALIVVICDGSWGKRSYGKGYSSLSGCAAIIGARTKKVLYFGVKNKYCHYCAISYANHCPPNYHDCNISYIGPSSGMETEILVEGFLFCETQGARFHKMISDGDSSAFKEITERCVYKNPDIEIEKIECMNHLFKNAQKKFTALCDHKGFKKDQRKMLKLSMGKDDYKKIIFVDVFTQVYNK